MQSNPRADLTCDRPRCRTQGHAAAKSGILAQRAEDARDAANAMRNVDARRAMLSIADQYESLARASERFGDRFGNPPEGWEDAQP